MLSSIEKTLHALDNHHIAYCHWKSNEHLDAALNGDTDLDMLFDPAQRSELESVFAFCGLKRFRSAPLMQYNAIEDYIGFDQETAKIWHMHTHYRMTLGEPHLKGYTITPWGSLLLSHRIRGAENVWTSDPSDELILLYCRIALKLRWRDLIRKLGKNDRNEIAWLKERVSEDHLASRASVFVGEKSKEIILRLFNTEIGNRIQFKQLQNALRKELILFTGYNRFSSWFTRTKREFFWLYGSLKRKMGWMNYHSNRRVSPSGGLVVALLGCDGAGKSTVLSYIKKEFGKKLDVVPIYFGSGDGSSSLIRLPMRWVARKVGGRGVGHEIEKEYAEKKTVSFKSRMYSAAKVIWAVTLAKEKQSKQKKKVKARNNGLLVLTDRYPQSIVPGASDGPLLSRYRNQNGLLKRIAEWEQKIYEGFAVNAPDLAIKLMVPTKIAIARKPEMTEEEIENKKRIVMDMDISDHTVIIDTSCDLNTTCAEVMREIWNLI